MEGVSLEERARRGRAAENGFVEKMDPPSDAGSLFEDNGIDRSLTVRRDGAKRLRLAWLAHARYSSRS